MQIMVIIALTFGVLFLIDKGFTRIFRGKAQHKTGLSVRQPRAYCTAGIILSLLAVMAVITAIAEKHWQIGLGGGIIALMGGGLIVFYLTFGIFYDDDSFILTTFGSKSRTYRFSDIVNQQLYVITGGSTVVELYLTDGRSVSLHSKMEGMFGFMDKAFHGWCRQKGIDPDTCQFHDPDNGSWFPPVEG